MNHKDFDLPIANIRHTDCPHYYRYAKPGEVIYALNDKAQPTQPAK